MNIHPLDFDMNRMHSIKEWLKSYLDLGKEGLTDEQVIIYSRMLVNYTDDLLQELRKDMGVED